jgi:hypothetical protein
MINLYLVCILHSQGCKGIKCTVWFRFFQKDQIWPRCCPYHTFSIFDGRQGRHPPGPSFWRNPIWPPPGLNVNHSRSTKKARIIKNTTFKEFLGQTISFLIIITTVFRQDQQAKVIFYVSELNFTSIFSTFLVFFYKCSVFTSVFKSVLT